MTAPVDTAAETVTEDTAATPTPATENVEVEKEPVDLTAFQAAVDALIAAVTANPASELTDELFEVRKEYHELDRVGKAAARKAIEDGAVAAIMGSRVTEAQALLRTKDEMLKAVPASGTPRAPRTPKNVTDEVVATLAGIQLAYSYNMVSAQENPALDDDWQERVANAATQDAATRVAAYVGWLEAKQEGAEPEANDIEKAAARIALGRAPKGQGRKPKAVEEAAKAAEAAEGESTPAE